MAEADERSAIERADAAAKFFFTYVERATLLGVLFAITPAKPGSVAFLLNWQGLVFSLGGFLIVWPLMARFARWVAQRYPRSEAVPVRAMFVVLVVIACGGAAFMMSITALRIGELLASIAN